MQGTELLGSPGLDVEEKKDCPTPKGITQVFRHTRLVNAEDVKTEMLWERGSDREPINRANNKL